MQALDEMALSDSQPGQLPACRHWRDGRWVFENLLKTGVIVRSGDAIRLSQSYSGDYWPPG
jgi:hypothetical protein